MAENSRTENSRMENFRAENSRAEKSVDGSLSRKTASGGPEAGKRLAAAAQGAKAPDGPAANKSPAASFFETSLSKNILPDTVLPSGISSHADAASSTGAELSLREAAFRQLALSLGLPADKLSAALLSFARYFSLPLEASTLVRLRRDLPSARASAQAAIRAGAALGAAAGEDKGVSLSQKALLDYEAAIDPARRDSGQGSGRGSGEREASGFHGEGRREEEPSGRAIKERAEDFCGIGTENSVLGFLNGIKGTRGRWMVFPFGFDSDGQRIEASLRVLVTGDALPGRVERLALDVAGKRRWLFMLDKPGREAAASAGSAFIRVEPPLSGREKALFEKEAALLLSPFVKETRIVDGLSFFADAESPAGLPVDVEV